MAENILVIQWRMRLTQMERDTMKRDTILD